MIQAKHVHCIGIGGIGLSALAQLLKAEDKEVSGCDQTETPWLDFLEKQGIKIFVPHNTKHIEDADLVIHTLALEKTHPELKAAQSKKIPTLSYPQALGEITKNYRTIAICGTHGKTTVTSMIAKILIENGKDPTVIVGTQSFDLNGNNFRKGKSDLLVLEACEYERAFLEYTPYAIVITNIDYDHFDTYPTEKSYNEAFFEFARKLPKDGMLVGNFDDPKIVSLFEKLGEEGFAKRNLLSFAVKNESADFTAQKIPLKLKIPGKHNLSNALAAYALAHALGIKSDDILYSLNRYEGSGRRLEEKGIIRGVRVIDDYAHHPTEIKASLQALREKYPKEKMWVVYQPHQFIRTKYLLNEFGEAFKLADHVIIPNIYDARDFGDATKMVSVDDLVSTISKKYKSIENGNGFENTAALLKKHWEKFDLLIIMGAGDVWKITQLITRQ